MKGHILCLTAAALVFFFISAAAVSFAHPPSDITATYTPEGKKLAISVRHQVPSTENHYVSEITVMMDNKVIAKKTFTTQSSKVSQDVTFVVPENLMEKTIVVEAKCSVRGVLKKSIEFKKPEEKKVDSGTTPQPTPTGTKAPAGTKQPTGVTSPGARSTVPAGVKTSPSPTAAPKT